MYFPELDGTEPSEGLVEMEHANVRKVWDSGNCFQEPEALNWSFVEEPIQEQATQIVQGQTDRMGVDSTPSGDPCGLSCCYGLIGKGQSQTRWRTEGISLFDSDFLGNFVNNCRSLANEIRNCKVPRRIRLMVKRMSGWKQIGERQC
jgi:hypothetical protein